MRIGQASSKPICASARVTDICRRLKCCYAAARFYNRLLVSVRTCVQNVQSGNHNCVTPHSMRSVELIVAVDCIHLYTGHDRNEECAHARDD